MWWIGEETGISQTSDSSPALVNTCVELSNYIFNSLHFLDLKLNQTVLNH